MAHAEHVSEMELFDSAVHLFTGPALKWYMTMRSTNSLFNWQHLIWELKKAFMHPDLDALIRMKIYNRKQQRNESFREFYHEMEKLFQTMNIQMPEQEKLQILSQNMRIDYKKQINFVSINNISSLLAAGQKMDAIHFSVYNKVFGNEKSVHVVTDTGTKPKTNIKEHQNTPPTTSNQNSNSNQNRSNSNQSNNRSSNPPPPSNERRPQQSSSTPPQSNQPRASTSSSTSTPFIPGTLEHMIINHRPPPRNQCFNCGHFGHQMANCRCPRSVLCEVCGFRGYPTDNCPYCLKNSPPVGQNRRPLN